MLLLIILIVHIWLWENIIWEMGWEEFKSTHRALFQNFGQAFSGRTKELFEFVVWFVTRHSDGGTNISNMKLMWCLGTRIVHYGSHSTKHVSWIAFTSFCNEELYFRKTLKAIFGFLHFLVRNDCFLGTSCCVTYCCHLSELSIFKDLKYVLPSAWEKCIFPIYSKMDLFCFAKKLFYYYYYCCCCRSSGFISILCLFKNL